MKKQLAAEGKVRIIILKARQQGLSTYVGGYLYFGVSQQSPQGSHLAHQPQHRALFDMVGRYHQHCPELLKPHTKYSAAGSCFDVLDSSLFLLQLAEIASEGETLTHVHASELARWREVDSLRFTTVSYSRTEHPGTAVFIESTANGVRLSTSGKGSSRHQWLCARVYPVVCRPRLLSQCRIISNGRPTKTTLSRNTTWTTSS